MTHWIDSRELARRIRTDPDVMRIIDTSAVREALADTLESGMMGCVRACATIRAVLQEYYLDPMRASLDEAQAALDRGPK